MAFGSQTAAPTFGGFSFGASTSTTSTPSFSSSPFGTAGTAISGSGTGFGFGSTPTATTTTAQSFFGGSSALSTPATTSVFPGFGQTTTAATPGLSFGGFGTSNPSNTTVNFGGGLTGGVPAPTSVTTTNIGLGGVDLQASSVNGPDAASKKDKAVKETFIPNEIIATYEAYKKFIKDQKAVREEMSRVSSKNILKVQSQVSALRQQLSVVSNGVQRNASAIAKLKQESSEELQNAELIQRTKDTPQALQYENTAPSTYFHNLAINFENQMQCYRQQIEQLERHLMSLSQPSTMTPNELAFVMKRLHDAFVTLAAQLQTVHQQIQHQKEQLSAIIKSNQSSMSVFQSQSSNKRDVLPAILPSVPAVITAGPTSVTLGSNIPPGATTYLQNGTQQMQGLISGTLSTLQKSNSGFGFSSPSNFKPLGQSSGVSFGSPGVGGGGGGFFGDSTAQSAFGVSNQKPFMLQKPPSGNKRGKRWTST